MVFIGIGKRFSLKNEEQYDTIGAFWDDLASKYGLENLKGLGYDWQDGTMAYAIGLKDGIIAGANVQLPLPDNGWESVVGDTDRLKDLYDDIYAVSPLQYEIETFFDDGTCHIEFIRQTIDN